MNNKLKILPIKKTDIKELSKITSNKSIMKFVGDGKSWSNNKTIKFIKYSIVEQNNNINKRRVFYYKISLNKKLIGIIGIHKYDNENDYNLTYYIGKKYQGKCYGTYALRLILKKLYKIKKSIGKVVSQVLVNNIGSQKSCKKAGFIFQKNIKRNGKKYKQYIYLFKLHNILKLDYPYLSEFISLTYLKKSFNMLKKYSPIFKNGSNKGFKDGVKIIINFDKERIMNQITDYFTDICRVKCVFKGKKSPYEYYKQNKINIIKKSILGGKFNINKFENVMFNSHDSKFCNNFQSTIAFTLYKLFKAKRVFDSSSGWGDRLIAAIAYGCEYTGVDPSNCLEPLYKKIINTLTNPSTKSSTNSSVNSLKYRVIKSGIEDVKVKENYHDLCLTSPPFFDLEIYENSEGQSIKKFTTEKSWERDFLRILVEKNVKTLKKGGHLVLYIPSYYKDFMNYMKKHKKLKYVGIFSFLTPKKRDIFVWVRL
tara:strand:- start:2264 stop:3706 length:1443 start_codon:yes stop_codon:yes gene_type:complete